MSKKLRRWYLIAVERRVIIRVILTVEWRVIKACDAGDDAYRFYYRKAEQI